MAEVKLHRLDEVRAIVGLSRTQIYLRIGMGDFPPPRQLPGGHAVAWRSDELQAFIEKLPPADFREKWSPLRGRKGEVGIGRPKKTKLTAATKP